MSKQSKKILHSKFSEVPDYGIVFFDNAVKGDYKLVKITDQADRELLDEILERRVNGTLTWQDIYTFDLTVLKYIEKIEPLTAKVKSLRNVFKSLADPAELENSSIINKVDLDNASTPEDKIKLQTEYAYLIKEYCLRSAFIAATEHLRRRLLRRCILFTLVFFLIAASFVLYSYFLSIDANTSESTLNFLYGFSALLMVIFAGMTGAFVSILQRLLNSDNRANPISNLSLLSNNWLSIFLSPLSGAIFAVILYLFFAGSLITGKIFPAFVEAPPPKNIVLKGGVVDDNKPGKVEEISNQTNPIQFAEFLSTTGPISGTDYALLLIWSFIAGFAERFVPDNLMSLVRQKKNDANETA